MPRIVVGVILLLLAGVTSMEAQETQVAMDAAGRIQVITPELASRLGLFPDVPGFQEARLFSVADASFVLEITTSRRGTVQRERRPFSAAEADAFRRDVSERVTSRAPSAALDQSGRTKLLVGSTVLGLGYYGWATALAFDPDNSQTAVAVYMLASSTTFFAPYLVTRNRHIPQPVANMALWGAMRGPIHGFLLSYLGDARSDKTRFGWSVAFGAAETITGGLVASRLGMNAGRAELTGVGGDIGMGVGLLAANVLGLDDRQRWERFQSPGFPADSFPTDDRTLQAAVTLAASGLGLVGGYLGGGSGDWTVGDAVVFRNVTAIGAIAGLAAGDIVHQPRLITLPPPAPGFPAYSYYEDDFSRPHSASALVGTAGAMLLGRALVRGRNFTGGQGTLLTLAPLAGGLIGLGIAYWATPEKPYDYTSPAPARDPNDHSELYLSAAAVGATAGFAALYPTLSRQAKGISSASRFDFSVNPLAFAHFAGRGKGTVTVAEVRYRF